MRAELSEADWFPPFRPIAVTLGEDWRLVAQEPLPDGDYFVYAVVTAEDAAIQRASGKHSRLLYVGMGYRNRPASLLKGIHSASHALDQLRCAMKKSELDLELWVCPALNGALHEIDILNRCARAYGELPPANRKWEGYLSGAVLREMVGWALQDADRSRAHLSPYEYPYDAPCSVWVDGMSGKKWEFSLGWIHTTRMRRGQPHPLAEFAGQLLLVPGAGNGNALARSPLFESWGKGGVIQSVAADPLDGLDESSMPVKQWLDHYAGTAWKKGNTPLETLAATLREPR